jgi:hypothetical protein
VDWYLVTSRVEGGPQSILEASYRKTKILSTMVGLAPEILHPNCLCFNKDDFCCKILSNVNQAEYNYNVVVNNYIPSVLIPKWDLFLKCCADD